MFWGAIQGVRVPGCPGQGCWGTRDSGAGTLWAQNEGLSLIGFRVLETVDDEASNSENIRAPETLHPAFDTTLVLNTAVSATKAYANLDAR